MAERVQPHDLTAERAVLGSVLLQPDMFDVAEGVGLKARMFWRVEHGMIWSGFGRLRTAGQTIDTVTLRSDLDAAGKLEAIGGMLYLAGLVDGVPHAVNVESYARIVREKALLRDLIAQASRTIEDAYANEDVEEVLDAAESRFMAVGRETAKGDFVLASDWMSEMFNAVDKAATERRVISGVPCGLQSVDVLTRGWQPAELIVIAGRPSDGKTSLMMQFANEASRHVFAGVVSLEMSRLSVGFRWVALEARVDAFRLMTGHLHPHEMQRVSAAMERLSERRLAIDDVGGQSIAGLCAKVRRLANRYGLGIVFVDYLQLIHGSGAENRTQEITQISGRLKALAKELNVPIVALSQLTRDSAKAGAAARPQLHNLRDGGSIEQDADVVILIHRPNKATESGRFQDGEAAELIVAKQRNGPANRILPVHWDGPTMRFADTEDKAEPVQERLA
jgi:replicative DNA helicase